MNATQSTQRFGSSRLGKTVVMFGFAVGLALGAVAPAAASNPFQGEGMRALGQDMEQSRPDSETGPATTSHLADPDCWKGEGFRVNPNAAENPCFAPVVLELYYECEAGEGLLDPASGTNPCREAVE